MNGLYETFQTNDDLETKGVWIEYGVTPDGPTRIRIARAGGKNTAFNKALEKATRPYRKALQTGSVATETIEALYRGAFIDHVILGWMNVWAPVLGADGKPQRDALGQVQMEKLGYTRANVERVLLDLPDMYNDLREQASSLALFREEERETDLGNFGKSSATDTNKVQ